MLSAIGRISVAQNTLSIPNATSTWDPDRCPSTPIPKPAPNRMMNGHGEVSKAGEDCANT